MFHYLFSFFRKYFKYRRTSNRDAYSLLIHIIYEEYIIRRALDGRKVSTTIDSRMISNVRFADDTTLMVSNED